jgi:hypothetical protein
MDMQGTRERGGHDNELYGNYAMIKVTSKNEPKKSMWAMWWQTLS